MSNSPGPDNFLNLPHGSFLRWDNLSGAVTRLKAQLNALPDDQVVLELHPHGPQSGILHVLSADPGNFPVLAAADGGGGVNDAVRCPGGPGCS
ncbi:MAG TPA: hypothetical protein VNH46_08635 [Gemmatimonadales bacterium]|nr:hypothetical protein [Gemmatimonadales bacterium]